MRTWLYHGTGVNRPNRIAIGSGSISTCGTSRAHTRCARCVRVILALESTEQWRYAKQAVSEGTCSPVTEPAATALYE